MCSKPGMVDPSAMGAPSFHDGAPDADAADHSGEPESLTAFEAAHAGHARARKIGLVVAALTAVVGLVATFAMSVSVAETSAGDAAADEGVEIAALMLVVTVALAATLGRFARDVVAATAMPNALRRIVLPASLAGIPMAFATFGLSLLTFLVGYQWVHAAIIERNYGLALFATSELPSYVRDRLPELALPELTFAILLAGAAAALTSRAARVDAGESAARPVRRRVLAVCLGIAITFVAAGAALYLLRSDEMDVSTVFIALLGGAVVGGIAVRVAWPRRGASIEAAALRDAARDDDVVQGALAEMRRSTRRRWGARAIAAVVGVAVTYGGIQVADWYYSDLARNEQPGLGTFLGLVALGFAVALAIVKRLDAPAREEPAALGDVGGLLEDALATPSITVRQQHTLLSLLFGDTGGQRFELVDGIGAWCGTAREQSSVALRLLLGWRRPLTIAVDDLGEDGLRIVRPTVWLRERATIQSGTTTLGELARTWSPIRTVFRVSREGRTIFTVASGWLFQRKLKVLREGQPVGMLERLRSPWYVRWFRSSLLPERDRFMLTFPPDATLAERQLLLGTLFLLDVSK